MAKQEHTYEDICRQITGGTFHPVYILMGEEPFFIDRITDLLLQHVIRDEAERDFNQTLLYGADVGAARVMDAARRFPMMAEWQLVVVREAQMIRDIELLAAYVKHPLPSTVLVINYKYKALDRRKGLALAAEKNGILFDSAKIPDYKMADFIASLLRQQGIGADRKAVEMLADYLGNDLNRLHLELDKLTLALPDGQPRTLTPAMIEQNVGISKEFNPFELVRALAEKDVPKATRVAWHLGKNTKSYPVQAILPVLFNFFSNLLICYYTKDRSENGLMLALGLRNRFQLKDYQAGMRAYSAKKAFDMVREIRLTDARSKGVENYSATDADLLKELVYRILH